MTVSGVRVDKSQQETGDRANRALHLGLDALYTSWVPGLPGFLAALSHVTRAASAWSLQSRDWFALQSCTFEVLSPGQPPSPRRCAAATTSALLGLLSSVKL